MKKSLITLFAVAGLASGATMSLDDLNNTYGAVIGGGEGYYANNPINTATSVNGTFSTSTSYSDLSNLFTNTNTWYVNGTCNFNVGYTNKDTITPNGVSLIAGGPKADSANGGIAFTLSADLLANFIGDLTLSFDASRVAGNNNTNHEIKFGFITSEGSYVSSVYNTKTGDNLLTDSPNVKLTLSSDIVESLKNQGTDQKVILVAETNQVTGSNSIVMMNNFALDGEMVPEPATASLSLLGLAALMIRRRR
ncbi:MAG: PEP-CTERM sorting domain-containing protein [Akkermansia sp.]|nr:PEP-CTERM sorting domain-containing protein [Akkermansia sp.]